MVSLWLLEACLLKPGGFMCYSLTKNSQERYLFLIIIINYKYLFIIIVISVPYVKYKLSFNYK